MTVPSIPDNRPPLTEEGHAKARSFANGEIPASPNAVQFGREIVRDLLAEVDRLRAENTALAGKIREFLDGERRIACRLNETDDQNEKMRLLGLCEARKTLRASLGDKAPTRRSCGAKAQFFADDLLYTIGCGKDHGHRDPHYSFTSERAWVDGGIPFRAALGETGGTER